VDGANRELALSGINQRIARDLGGRGGKRFHRVWRETVTRAKLPYTEPRLSDVRVVAKWQAKCHLPWRKLGHDQPSVAEDGTLVPGRALARRGGL
jgi:hypothetical protein